MPSRPLNEIIVRTALLAILAFAVAIVFNQYKGLPLAVVIFLAFLVLPDFVLRRTAYGRKVYALGGSVEVMPGAAGTGLTLRVRLPRTTCSVTEDVPVVGEVRA